MKKIILLLALFLGLTATAQVTNQRALGLRLGNLTEVTYQHPVDESTRLEFNLGLSSWKTQFVGINGIYQKVFDLSDLAQGVNWYAGGGLGLGAVAGSLQGAILGQIGIEYNLEEATELPLQLSLDYRPHFILPKSIVMFDVVGLAVRYKF